MGSSTCRSKEPLNRGAWTVQEDKILRDYITVHGAGKWNKLPQRAGLKRNGKSCRLRWLNYLRPNIKRGNISQDEEDLIIRLHKLLGNRWSLIAGRIPGRTDNEIKNYWNTNLAKRVVRDSDNDTSTTVSTTHQEKTNVFHAKASKCSKRLFIDHPLPHYSSMQSQGEFSNEMETAAYDNNELLSFPCSEFGAGKELSSTDHLLFDCGEDIGEVCLSDLLNLDFSDICDLGYSNNNNNNNNSSDEDQLTLWDEPMQSNLCDETNVANNVHSSTSFPY